MEYLTWGKYKYSHLFFFSDAGEYKVNLTTEYIPFLLISSRIYIEKYTMTAKIDCSQINLSAAFMTLWCVGPPKLYVVKYG